MYIYIYILVDWYYMDNHYMDNHEYLVVSQKYDSNPPGNNG